MQVQVIYIPSGNHCRSSPSLLTFFFNATFTSAFYTLCTSITFCVLYGIIYFCSFGCLPRALSVTLATSACPYILCALHRNSNSCTFHSLCTHAISHAESYSGPSSPSLLQSLTVSLLTSCVLYRISFTPTHSHTWLHSFLIFKWRCIIPCSPLQDYNYAAVRYEDLTNILFLISTWNQKCLYVGVQKETCVW